MHFDEQKTEDLRGVIEANYLKQAVLDEIIQSLHGADLERAFRIVLDRTGHYLDVSRVLLFEDSPDHRECRAIHEWCNDGIPSLLESGGVNLSYRDDIPDIGRDLIRRGESCVNYGEIPESDSGEFNKENIIAAAIFSVYHYGERYGFICFDECVRQRVWNEETLSFLRNIARLVSTAVMRRKSEDAVRASHTVLETVLDNMSSIVYVTDPVTNRIIFANRAFRDFAGADFANKTCCEVMQGDKRENCRACLERTASHPSGKSHSIEIYSGRFKEWIGLSVNLIPWVDGRIVRMVNSSVITEKKMREENMRRIAFTDRLTGLPNRYQCDIDLQKALDSRHGEESGCILLIDMDDFKTTNDGCGRDCGDVLLTEFAAFLQQAFSPDCDIYRFDGDEFALITKPGAAKKSEAVAGALIERCARPWRALDRDFYCTVSIGAARFFDGDCTAAELLKNADAAMLEAKKRGKNKVVYYSDTLGGSAIKRAELELLLRETVANGFQDFRLEYQPIVDAKTRRIAGVEALLCWGDRFDRMVAPEEFTALAETLGLIVPIGEYVLQKAALQSKTLSDAGFDDVFVSANVSMRQLRSADFAVRLAQIVENAGAHARNIRLEVAEGIGAVDIDHILTISEDLRKHGFPIVLDDFGAGCSSLDLMRRLPADTIKIDRSFVGGSVADAYAKSFVRLIADLAHSTGRTVCAGGVESEEQMNHCLEAGADLAQGQFLWEAMPPEALMELLQQNSRENTEPKPKKGLLTSLFSIIN